MFQNRAKRNLLRLGVLIDVKRNQPVQFASLPQVRIKEVRLEKWSCSMIAIEDLDQALRVRDSTRHTVMANAHMH